MEMPKISSVTQQAISTRCSHEVHGAIFCDSAALISIYRRLVTRHIATIST